MSGKLLIELLYKELFVRDQSSGHELLCGSQEKASVKCQGKDTVRKNRA